MGDGCFMKKWIALILALCLCVGLCACGGNAADNGSTEPDISRPSDSELEAMAQQAEEYEKNARFDKAIELYRQLHSYGYCFNPIPDSDIQVAEERYVKQQVFGKRFEELAQYFYTETEYARGQCAGVEKQLEIGNMYFREDETDPMSLYIEVNYVYYYGHFLNPKAMKSKVMFKVTFTKEEANQIAQVCQSDMDRLECTTDEIGKFLTMGGGSTIVFPYESQTEAILNGTATY